MMVLFATRVDHGLSVCGIYVKKFTYLTRLLAVDLLCSRKLKRGWDVGCLGGLFFYLSIKGMQLLLVST